MKVPMRLKIYVFFFSTFLVGSFVGGSLVDLLDQQEQIARIPFPSAPAAPVVSSVSSRTQFARVPGIAWADINDPNTSTMPVYGAGAFYVEPLFGSKLLVKQVQGPNGKILYDIYAMPDKEAIFGK